MGCIKSLAKFLVFAANLLFALAGIALIVVGVLYKVNLNHFTNAIPEDYQNIGLAPTFTIAIGSVIFVIAFFGCCGAIKESPCLLTTYAVILLIIFLLQLAIGIFALVKIKDEETFEAKVNNTLTGIFNNYNIDSTNTSKEIVDFMQQQLECCGLTGPSYWAGNTPNSCIDRDSSENFEDGCVAQFFDFLQRSTKVIGIVVLSVSLTELISTILSFYLSSSIKKRNNRTV